MAAEEAWGGARTMGAVRADGTTVAVTGRYWSASSALTAVLVGARITPPARAAHPQPVKGSTRQAGAATRGADDPLAVGLGAPGAQRRAVRQAPLYPLRDPALAALLGGVRSEAGRADPTPLSAVRQSRGVPAARGAAWAGDPSSTRTEFVKQLHHDRRGGVVTTGECVRVV